MIATHTARQGSDHSLCERVEQLVEQSGCDWYSIEMPCGWHAAAVIGAGARFGVPVV